METKRDRILSNFLSILLHLIIILCLLYPYLFKEEKQEPTQDKVEENFAGTLSEEQTKADNVDQVFTADIIEASASKDDNPCTLETSSYIGVGIVHSLSSNMIMQAPEQYPAYRAGIRKGDIFISVTEDGEYKNLTVTRNGITLEFHIKTQPICYE